MIYLTLVLATFAFALGVGLSLLALIMTMLPGRLGDFFASTAIVMWLEDTVFPISCAGLLITSLCHAVVG